MKLDIVILAAGMGKRMHSTLPKVLHPIAGITMLERVVTTAKTLNPHKIYVIHGNNGDIVREALPQLQVVWIEQKQQLGTAHAVSQVLPTIDANHLILVLYGDVPLVSTKLLKSLIANAENQFGLVTARVPDPTGLGRIIRDSSGKIAAIIEERDADATQQKIQEINTGIMLLPAKFLKEQLPNITNNNAQQEYYLTDIISLAVAANKTIHGVMAHNATEVLGVNDKQQLAAAERYFQLRQAQQFMHQGLTLLDPARFDLRGELEFGKDVVIDVNVVLAGTVKLGNRVKILANSIIEDAVIEDDAVIGPFARIRPGSVVKSKAKVGNFVELKKVTLGTGSKASHLSYLGDAEIGTAVNIGAGTIICNYDGVNKHKTTIEDGAFIGSNTALVAPVTVGKNATIGAGSTITQNAPAEELTLSRSKQYTIKGWNRPRKK